MKNFDSTESTPLVLAKGPTATRQKKQTQALQKNSVNEESHESETFCYTFKCSSLHHQDLH